MRRRVPSIAALAIPLVLALAACGGGSSSTPPAATPASPTSGAPSADGSAEVTIEGFAFRPADVTVRVGTTVAWANRDDAPHSVQWADGTPTSETLTSGGAPYERTFDTPGTFAYACGIHPSMTGSVIVEP